MITFTYVLRTDKITVIFPYDTAAADFVKGLGAQAVYKTIPTKTFDGVQNVKKFSHWEMELTQETNDKLRDIQGTENIHIDPVIFAAWDTKQEHLNKNLALSMAKNSSLEFKEPLQSVLKNYQRAGVEYIRRNPRGVFVGDGMGLGKTLETLAALESGEMYPALIVCPAVVKYNWGREVEKWIPHRHYKILNGYKDKPESGAEIFIINYDILEKWMDLLTIIPFKTLVCDEAHYLKNYKAKRTEIIIELSKDIPRRILLSGTPVLNRPQELIAPLMIMDRLNEMGGFWKFANYYCQAKRTRYGWDLSGAANLAELNLTARSLFYIRREKTEVLTELPEKTIVSQWVRIDNGPEYDAAQADVIQYLKDNVSDEAALKAKRAEALVKINVLKQIAARGKLKSIKAWVENYFENGTGSEKLVIFAWHTEIIKAIASGLNVPASIITGDVSSEERDRIVNDFQNNPLTRVIVANIQAGGVGITLTAADTALFVELGWNPGTMAQAEDRIHRIGQVNPVMVYYMLAEGTIDLATWKLIRDKEKIIDEVTDGFKFVRDYLIKKGEK